MSRKAMFGRVDQFWGEPEIVLPPAGVTLRTELGTIITALKQLGSDQVSGRGERSAGATTRQMTAADLRKKVRGVSRVAGRLHPDLHPGVAEKFRMPRNTAFEVLISFRVRRSQQDVGLKGFEARSAFPNVGRPFKGRYLRGKVA